MRIETPTTRIDEITTSTTEHPATIRRGRPPPVGQPRDLVVSRDLPPAGRDRPTGPHEPADEARQGGKATARPPVRSPRRTCARPSPSRLKPMTILHYLIEGRYVRLLCRDGRPPVAYLPDSRQRVEPVIVAEADPIDEPPGPSVEGNGARWTPLPGVPLRSHTEGRWACLKGARPAFVQPPISPGTCRPVPMRPTSRRRPSVRPPVSPDGRRPGSVWMERLD